MEKHLESFDNFKLNERKLAEPGNYSTDEGYFADIVRIALEGGDRVHVDTKGINPGNETIVTGYLKVVDENDKPYKLKFKIDMDDILKIK